MDKGYSSNVFSFFDDEPMFIYDYNTYQILDVNNCAVNKYGFSKSEFQSRKITDLGEKQPVEILPENGSERYKPTEVWRHVSKQGEEWLVQITTQQFKYKDRIVKLAIAHNVEGHVRADSADLHSFPKIDESQSHFPLGMIEFNHKLEVRDWSAKAQDIFGWSYSDIIHKDIASIELMPDDLVEVFNQKVDKLQSNRDIYFTIEGKYKTKAGKDIYCKWHNAIIYDSYGNILSIYSMIEDRTKKQGIINQLKESEEKFRVLSESSFVSVYMIQEEKFVYVNPKLCGMSGYNQAELLGDMLPRDLLHADDTDKYDKLLNIWKSRRIDSFEIQLKISKKDGSTIFVKTYGARIKLNGKPTVVGVAVDQTEAVQTNEELIRSVKSYKTLFDSIGDAIYIHNDKGEFIEMNCAAVKMYGYTKEELIGKEPDFLAAPGKVDLQATKEKFTAALNGDPQKFQWWGRRKNGEVFPKQIKLSPGHYFGKKAVIAISRDISEEFKREKEIRENEQLFRQLFQNSPIGIALLDNHNDVILTNDGFEDIFGYSTEEVKGICLDKLIVPDDKLEEAKRLSNSTEPFMYTTRRVTKNGETIEVLIYGVPVIVDEKIISIYGIYIDITEQIKYEQKIEDSLQEKEILLAEIHHRVKNNMAVITGLLELQTHHLTSDEAVEALKDSQMRINTMGLIHEKLYQSENFASVNFEKYIRELLQIIQDAHEHRNSQVSINIQVGDVNLPITKAIPCGLIINEIVTNSFKHAFKGIDQPEISISFFENNGVIEMSVKDNGIGLRDELENLSQNSLGIILIKTLSSQISGSLNVNGENGTSYCLTFENGS